MFRILSHLIIICVCFVSRYAHAGELSWGGAQLRTPSVYRIIDKGDKVEIQKSGKVVSVQSKETHIQLTLQYEEDAIIELPQQVLKLPSLRVHNGRHIRVIGGHLEATMPANETVRGLLWFGGTRGSVYVEGLVLDGAFQNGMDALLVGAYRTQTPDQYPDIYVQNTILKNVENKNGNTYHSDCFQYYGNVANTYMDRVHCLTNTQGFFLAAQHEVGAIDLRRVTIEYANPRKANGYALYLRDNKQKRRPSISLQDVYVGRRLTNFKNGHDSKWELYSVFPHAFLKNGAQYYRDTLRFPHNPEISGVVKRRNGEFFVEGAGAGYQR